MIKEYLVKVISDVSGKNAGCRIECLNEKPQELTYDELDAVTNELENLLISEEEEDDDE